jgi:hypothetical protein
MEGLKKNITIDRALSNIDYKKEALTKSGHFILCILNSATVHNLHLLQQLSKSVIFIKLPANTTAVIQPLDCGNLIKKVERRCH